jgi:fructan beta-fructosidase
MIKFVIPILFVLFVFGCSNKPADDSTRSKLHFTTDSMALDNPVELIHFEHEYLLFYHCSEPELNEKTRALCLAKSKDLIHWDTPNKVQFSKPADEIEVGSIIVDWENSSGYGNELPPFVAFYTADKNSTFHEDGIQKLYLSVSNDRGKNWIPKTDLTISLDNFYHPLSDLKVFWHEETQRWIMLVLTDHEVRIYSSGDLVNWQYESVFGEDVILKIGNWTTLDFFPIQTDSNEKRWVLFISGDKGSPNEGSGIQYFIGDFDGYVFKSLTDKQRWLDNGTDLYAGITLSDYYRDGLPLYMIGKIDSQKDNGLKQSKNEEISFSIPRQLFLNKKLEQYFLSSKPVNLNNVKGKELSPIKDKEIHGEVKLNRLSEFPLEINLSFNLNNRLYLDMAQVFGIRFTSKDGQELDIGYHTLRRYFFIINQHTIGDGSKELDSFNYMPYIIDRESMDIKIIMGEGSIELFAVDGEVSITKKWIGKNDWDEVVLFAEDGKITLNEFVAYHF